MSDYISRTVTAGDLARLKTDREAADAAYNAALTAVDAALQKVPALPHPPPGPDEHQITPLNESWDILRAAPAPATGWRALLTRFVWRVVEPAFGAQQRFNSLLIDHVNRNLARDRAVAQAIESSIGLARTGIEASIGFQSQLILYLQTLTPFVDTKDYEFAALARRATEDVVNATARLDEVARGLAGGLSGVSDQVLKHAESMAILAQRQTRALDEVRTALATAQQTIAALQRHVERAAAGGSPEPSPESAPPRPGH
jgi:hypothetical protein